MTPLITLEIPLPPSINTFYRTIVRGQRAFPIISAGGRLYQKNVAPLLADQLQNHTTLVGPIRLDLDIHVERRGSDWDNRIKVACDCLQEAGVYSNDRQICGGTIDCYYGGKESTMVIRIYPETDPDKIEAFEKS